MNHTKEQITEIAKKAMADIDWPYDEKKIILVFSSIEDQVEEVSILKDHPKFNENVANFISYWTAGMDFPEEEGWQERNTYFIEIKDEDREPYKISQRQAKFRLLKNDKGKYYTVPIVRGS